MATSASDDLNLREQIVRIDKMQAELNKTQVELSKIVAETLKAGHEAAKVQQDTRFQPITLAITGAGAGAALFAAGATFVKLLLG